jgi:Protein of unknown function (DUF2516)
VRQVSDIYHWIDLVLYVASVALSFWAIVDCAFRKARAFPAVNKLTKFAWLGILVASGVLSYFFGGDPVRSLIGSAAVVAALVYLCDVRPAVREVSGGR